MSDKLVISFINECYSIFQTHIIESTSFKDNEGNTYNIQGSINCKTVGVIIPPLAEWWIVLRTKYVPSLVKIH
jgi:hypothetical protein